MPLTPFQKQVVRLLAVNRNPDSHVAGGAVLNRASGGLRYSDDLDIFHDSIASLIASVAIDEATLLGSGYAVEWTLRTESLQRAIVSRGDDQLRLDWAADTAFRFFPVQEDSEFGFCLQADLAVNKALALAGRMEPRDYLDVLELDVAYLSLGAMVWAACGKDPGYTPALMLQMANRHSRHREEDLGTENLARPVDVRALKVRWVEAMLRAEALSERLPAEELGCLYLDDRGEPCTPEPHDPGFSRLRRHFGSVRGAWPRVT